ncbi:MAG: hypothetical protein JSU81_10865 [Candidatus Coatesbacteria bacterium]|nr:MAG: hypothetical protein JSU81_10865 [Candidatus Coatesbacteria bacterium]
MRGLFHVTVAAAAAVAVAAVPAAGNPYAEEEVAILAHVAPIAILGGLTVGFVIYKLYQSRAAGRPRFVGEEVTIALGPERARVAGVYRFHNPGDKSRTLRLRYPFARGPELGEPENIVVRGAAGDDLPFTWKRHDIAFEVTIPPQAEAEIVVAYEQRCRGCEFTYILTSTRSWRRPIEEATFAVDVPPQLAPLEGSYELEEVASPREGVVRYQLRREDFYPDVDLVLRWERPDFYFGSTALEGNP